jgi:hypothetical protein
VDDVVPSGLYSPGGHAVHTFELSR